MKYTEKGAVKNLKIAYIGGGSRGWAWTLMNDLALAPDISGEVHLYDIDFKAAQDNEIIGNRYSGAEGCKSKWKYKAVETLPNALKGADFVIISILPGTFDEMESDVHTPEEYGIHQSVGDTNGPGGIIRALRTLPMMQEIAAAVKEYCPNAWVINYTNPMTLCMSMLYKEYPEIKAFGCCHEVFGTQTLLADALKDILGIDGVHRNDVKVNVLGINHFTWITRANYKNIDLFPVYKEFAQKYKDTGFGDLTPITPDTPFSDAKKVKFDLFLRFGVIAAAGDRHLAEFCPGDWYLQGLDHAKSWGFNLTEVKWRRKDLAARLEKSRKLVSGDLPVTLSHSGEEGVKQIRALLGLGGFVTNVNLPNWGQIPNLPIGAIVETNAAFRDDSLTPLFAGNIPDSIYPLIAKTVGQQRIVLEAAYERDLEKAFMAFSNDTLMRLNTADARRLFDKMVDNTKAYLANYFK